MGEIRDIEGNDAHAMTNSLPGSPQQQAILRTVLNAYAQDETILTMGVFGSTVRADADEFSDIDLDVLVSAEHVARAPLQIQQLVNYLDANGFPTLLIVRDGDHEAEILLESLDRIDLTIHTPETSKTEVLRDLVLIRGDASILPKEGTPAITAQAAEQRLQYLHGKMPILALLAANKLSRGKLWSALVVLDMMREFIMEIYGLSRGSTLPERHFIKYALPELQAAMGDTLTTYNRASIATGLKRIIDLYRTQGDKISNGRLQISNVQANVFDRVESLISPNLR